MRKIRIWTLESDYDAEAVKSLAEKIVSHLKLNDIFIHTSGKSAIPKRTRQEPKNPSENLKRAVRNYLKDDDCVIFVIDTDGSISSSKRQKEPNSFINQVKKVLNDQEFSGKVHMAEAVNEIEAWLLIDCEGIFCYFARKRYPDNCKEKIKQDKKFSNLIKRYQKGNTELIEEAEMGAKGPKEYLEKYSENILIALNPKMKGKNKNLKTERYRESLSPEIAKYIEVNNTTVKRNASLKHLGTLISKQSNSR